MPAPRVIYEPKPGSPLAVDRDLYARLAENAGRTLVERFVVPRRSGRAWPVRAGQLFRLIAVDGPQVADLNVWSLDNPRALLGRAHAPASSGAPLHLRPAVVVPALSAPAPHHHR